MSNQSTLNNNSISVSVSNWRRIINSNQRVLNCPCRVNKRDYLNVKSLLKHYKNYHPSRYEEAKQYYSQRHRVSDSRGLSSVVKVDEASFVSDSPVEMDWDSSDMQIIMEDPSSVADVVVDEDLDESIEVDRLNTLSDNEEAEVPYESTHESESEAEMDDENHYYDDYRQFLHVIQPFIAKLNNATTVAGESMLPDIQEIRQAINVNSEDMETIHDTGSHPYRNMASFLLHALFFGDEDLASERSIKKIMYAMELLLELKEENSSLTLPAPDAILNYQNRIKNRIPVFKTTEHQVMSKSTGEMQTFFMNKPSEYLKHIVADPLKGPKVSALPDDAPDEIMTLQQGSKWREHPMFQHPMISTDNRSDIWVGDVVPYSLSSFLLINQFLTKRNAGMYVKYARGYGVITELDVNHGENGLVISTTFGVSVDLVDVPIEQLDRPVDKKSNTFQGEGCSIKLTSEMIVYTFFEQFKRRRPDNSLMKVVNVPLILFSDDTSGNKSKQYNKYDSFLMVPAAMSFEERNARDSYHFVCTANKVLSAVDMLPPLVDDLCSLEEGVEMYSAVYNKYVLVISPILFISGDNPRHSQLAMHKGTCSSFFCRKCLMPTPKNPNRDKKTCLSNINSVVHDGHIKRTLNLKLAVKSMKMPSFDATQDTPAEMLHCIPLGIARYLVTVLVKSTLLSQQQKDTIQSFLKSRSDNRYLQSVEQFCSELVHSLLTLDKHLIRLQIANPPNISLKPKLHLLTHPPEDIRRFGCALHYETEKGEQFNKFIREHLLQTNRQNTSRDVAVRFGRQFMFRFIYNGGTFLVCVKKRGEAHVYRSQAGYLISKFKDDHPDMGGYFLEGRENANYAFGHVVSSSLENGASGLFKGPHGNFFFGRIRVEVVITGNRKIKKRFIQPYLPCPLHPDAP
ncbi:hypothetical protein EDC94DRAFT_667540 [Helicostylum pulchrum]|nr:hypothetical protein EDC94DRAFT_667540 [Helicostylum pulchrum]